MLVSSLSKRLQAHLPIGISQEGNCKRPRDCKTTGSVAGVSVLSEHIQMDEARKKG